MAENIDKYLEGEKVAKKEMLELIERRGTSELKKIALALKLAVESARRGG